MKMIDNFKNRLTTQQIQELQTKWNIPSEFKIEGTEWWGNLQYWIDICLRQDLPEEFKEEYKEILDKAKVLKLHSVVGLPVGICPHCLTSACKD